MNAKNLAIAFGAAYLVVGILGFLPGITQPPSPDAPDLAMDTGYGNLMGIFPVNMMHNLVHLVAGIWGIAAGVMGYRAARRFGQVWAVIFGLLTIMGIIPGANTMFGMAPLYGSDVVLHLFTTGLAAYIGWFAPAERVGGVARERATGRQGA